MKIICKTGKLIIAFGLVLCILSSSVLCYADLFHKSRADKDGVTNILVLGEDKDNTESMNVDANGNADGEIIVSINEQSKKIVLTSLARDSFLYVDGELGTKATLIYHYSGKEALCDAIESNLGIHIDNTVIFNYYSIMDIVDHFGGIDMEVSEEELYFINEKIEQMNILLLDLPADDGVLMEPGMVHMNGKQAACYMRIRISGVTMDDFGRTERTRNVIFALKDKVMVAKKTELISLAKIVMPNMEFDFSVKEFLSLAGDVLNFKEYELISQCIPQEGTYTTSDGYVYMNYEKNREFLQQTIYN